jgi:hypothetical protein
MLPTPHPEVLAQDWLPPVVLGREAEVAELVRRLDPPSPRSPPPWFAGVVGPRGSGTSAVARRAAREVADRVRTAGAGSIPRWIAVRAARARGTHGVAAAMLQVLDEGFDGRGFSVPEILAGVLRRLRRDARPCVVVLDDVRVGGPDLSPILRAIGNPDRFLPEGENGLPPLWSVIAGTPEAIERLDLDLGGRFRVGPCVALAPYAPRGVRRLLEDRASRALGRAPAPDLVDRIVAASLADGGGATRAIDLLRRALVGAPTTPRGSAYHGARDPAIPIESWVLRAIEEAAQGHAARVGEVRQIEERYAREQGVRPLPATTLWRRIVRLEQAGYVRREVRPGGVGGTRSTIRVVAPVDEWVTVPRHRETRPRSAEWTAPDVRNAEPSAVPNSRAPVPGGAAGWRPSPRAGAT